MSKKKILFVLNYKPSTGGITGQVEALINNLDSENYESEIFSTYGKIFGKISSFFRLLNTARKFDIIHVHGCSDWGFLPIVMGVITGKIFNKKIIATYHGGCAEPFFTDHPNIVNLFLRFVHKITVPSNYLKQVFVKFNYEVEVLTNIICIKGLQFKKRDKLVPHLLVLKHLEPTYNIEMAIRCFGIVKQSYGDATLNIVGEGSESNMLKDLVSKLKLDDINFVGRVKHDQVHKYYSQSDIFIHTSKFESFGMVLLEAMASGLPVISTDVGGIPDVIKDGENGLLVKSNDYQSMAQKVILLLDNPKLAQRLIQNGSDCVNTKFAWESVKNKWDEVYIS